MSPHPAILAAENGIRALLNALRLVEEAGFGGEGVDGFRAGVVRMLSSRTKLEEELRDPNSKAVAMLRELGKPINNPDDIGPADDKWQQFKPIIEAMLVKPEGLHPEDVEILREALSAMPKE